MKVAQITWPAQQGEENHQLAALVRRFPDYHFGILSGKDTEPFIVGKPQQDGDFPDEDEVEMLRSIVTSLIDELCTGHMITDR